LLAKSNHVFALTFSVLVACSGAYGGSRPHAAHLAVRELTEPAPAASVTPPVPDSSAPIEDEPPAVSPPEQTVAAAPHPLDDVSDEEIRRRVEHDLESLGSISVGRPNGGALFNGVQMPQDDRWTIVDSSHTYGTQETIDDLTRVIAEVGKAFADTPPLYIGHISGPHGGPLSPHRSHQSGRDVDLGYYYKNDGHWYERATPDNLDAARTWTLIRAIVTKTDVEFLLIDHSLHAPLRQYAESSGEDPTWLDDLFHGTPPSRPPMIRHLSGHDTHMHVRFYNPIAQETGRRAYPALVAAGKVKPPRYTIAHRAKKGDSLIKLAKQYGTTVKAIQRANGLRSTKILAKKVYQIPHTGPAHAQSTKIAIPRRRLPPTP
jgi:penicillin-insensitive murein endopeptidase